MGHLQATASVLRKNILPIELSEKIKKWKQLVRKTKTHAKPELNHYLHEVFISFYHQKFLYLSFLC